MADEATTLTANKNAALYRVFVHLELLADVARGAGQLRGPEGQGIRIIR
jgi:hypothetical protein